MTSICHKQFGKFCHSVAAFLLISLFSSSAQAAFTDAFDQLLTELQSRSMTLSNRLDNIQKKQFKTVNQAINWINKPARSLANDLRTANRISKSLSKVFPDEFSRNLTIVAPISFANNLSVLLTNVFSGLQSDIWREYYLLRTSADNLPAGIVKTKVLQSVRLSLDAFLLAQHTADFKTFVNALGVSARAIDKGQKAVAKAGGPVGSQHGMNATIMVGGTNFEWIGEAGSSATVVQSYEFLDLEGEASQPENSTLHVSVCAGFDGHLGAYDLGGSCGGFTFANSSTSYLITMGTLNLYAFDTNSSSLGGIFSFTAADGTNFIQVTNGMFSLTNLVVDP